MIRLLGLALVLLFAPASLADPPKLSKILACPKDTESPKPGFCCRKGTQKPVLQRAYGVDAHCVFHGPIVYGDLALPRFTVINYEYGRLMGARWEIEDKKIHSMQEYRDSVASGTYREYDRKGRLFMEGHKDQGQLVGTWRAHIDSEKRSYVIHFNPLAESSPIQTCGLRSAKCSDVALPDAELALSHQNKVTEILGFYRPQENQYPQLFDTLETAFLPLRLGPGSDGPLLGIIVQNRLVTSWSNYHPFTYLDRDKGYVPVASREKGSCLVQLLPKPLPWVWIPCPNREIDITKQILTYKWSAPENPFSVRVDTKVDKGEGLEDIRNLIASGQLSIKPVKVFIKDDQQWVEGTLTDFARDLAWEINEEDLKLRRKLKASDYVGKTVYYPLVYENNFNFLPLDHN